MKSIFSFFMILIYMVSFTAGANTTKLEQKQKTEFVKTFNVNSNAVSVLNYYQVTFQDVALINGFNVVEFKIVAEPRTHLAIIADVGWRKSNQIIDNIPFTEKLKENSKNDLKFYKILKQNRIRENPFAEKQSFLYKRYC